MQDAFGRSLQAGDRVLIPATIQQLGSSSGYGNLIVELDATMPPEHSPTRVVVNTGQILRAESGDLAPFSIASKGKARVLTPARVMQDAAQAYDPKQASVPEQSPPPQEQAGAAPPTETQVEQTESPPAEAPSTNVRSTGP